MATQIGEIVEKGRSFPVFISDQGEFRVTVVQGEPAVTATSFHDLKERLKTAVRREHVRVEIPVLTVRGHRVVKGHATGLHATTGNLLMTWEDGHHDQSYGNSGYLDPEKLGPEGIEELTRVQEQLAEAEAQLKELQQRGSFERSLKDVVQEAINREADG